jgi:hypothetical protein
MEYKRSTHGVFQSKKSQDGDGSTMDWTGANPATHLVYTGAAVNPF